MAGEQVVARAEDVPPGTVRVVECNGKRLALCNVNGTFYAVDDVCTHDGGPLDQGELIGDEVECPRHGARFSVVTGRVTRLPAMMPLRTYAVRVEDGQIAVDAG